MLKTNSNSNNMWNIHHINAEMIQILLVHEFYKVNQRCTLLSQRQIILGDMHDL